MALPGETIDRPVYRCEATGSEPWNHHEPHDILVGVQQSSAGYYIGFFCLWDGPISRESRYYPTYEEAELALKTGTYVR